MGHNFLLKQKRVSLALTWQMNWDMNNSNTRNQWISVPFPLACRHLTLPGSLVKKRQVSAEGSLGNRSMGVGSSGGKEKALVRGRQGRDERVWQSRNVKAREGGSCRVPGSVRDWIFETLLSAKARCSCSIKKTKPGTGFFKNTLTDAKQTSHGPLKKSVSAWFVYAGLRVVCVVL